MTARDFAQTLGLLERFQLDHTAIGHHRGGKLAAKGLGLASRSGALVRWARGRKIDLALGHGSNDISVAAKLLRIPSVTAFDYEWARQQHQINCRLAARVVVPDVIPPERLAPYGATLDKLRRYEGLKEEYYLADFEPDAAVLDELGLDRDRRSRSCARRPRCRSITASRRRSSRRCSSGCAGEQVVVLPRTEQQRAELAREGGFLVPEQAIDAQSLIAFADLDDLGRRHHEPRGGGARHAGLDDVRGQARRGRRGADRRRPDAPADERRGRRVRAPDGRANRRTPRVRRDPEVFTDLFVKAG